MKARNIDHRLRAEFKEMARSIIADDRQARKYGRSQNTIGAIERALIRAFNMGRDYCEETSYVTEEKTFVEWELLPPRARDALWSISLPMSIPGKQPLPDEMTVTRIPTGKGFRWRVGNKRDKEAHTVASGGINPLVKMDILAPCDDTGEVLGLTEKGIATCREFWKRWESRDPSLPIMSVRA